MSRLNLPHGKLLRFITANIVIVCRRSIFLYLYVYELCTQLRLTTFLQKKMR